VPKKTSVTTFFLHQSRQFAIYELPQAIHGSRRKMRRDKELPQAIHGSRRKMRRDEELPQAIRGSRCKKNVVTNNCRQVFIIGLRNASRHITKPPGIK